MASLYRQYRPQTFADVVGQNHIKITLESEIKRGLVAHAYLFAGPRGIGKTTTARLLAKAISCQKRKDSSAEPCNDCDACRDITAGKALDVIEIDAASHTGVDNVRTEIIENARFTPQALKYKVFIIDEVHMLSTSAFNALLKILEEPPAHVVFILATTEIHKIPATVISRCQRFDFKRVGFDDIVTHLSMICRSEKVTCDRDVLELIARRSEGYLRDGVGLLGQIFSLGEKKITLREAELVIPQSRLATVVDFCCAVGEGSANQALILLNTLADEGVNIQQFAADTIEFFRRLLLAKVNPSSEQFAADLSPADVKRCDALVGALTLEKIVFIIDTFLQKIQLIKYSAIPHLPLELAIVAVCQEPGNRESGIGNRASSTTVSQPAALPADPKPEKSTPPRPELGTKAGGKVEKKTVKKPTNVSLDDIKEQWPALVDHLIDSHHSLALTLKIGQPLTLNGNVLTVGFTYPFHSDRVNSGTSRRVVEDTLSELFGSPLTIVTVVSDEVKIDIEEETTSTSPLTEVIEAFGGEVVG